MSNISSWQKVESSECCCGKLCSDVIHWTHYNVCWLYLWVNCVIISICFTFYVVCFWNLPRFSSVFVLFCSILTSFKTTKFYIFIHSQWEIWKTKVCRVKAAFVVTLRNFLESNNCCFNDTLWVYNCNSLLALTQRDAFEINELDSRFSYSLFRSFP